MRRPSKLLWLEMMASVAVVPGRKRRALALYERVVEAYPCDELALSTIGNLHIPNPSPAGGEGLVRALRHPSPLVGVVPGERG